MLARLAIKNIANCDVFTGEFQLTLSSSLVLFVPIFSSFVSWSRNNPFSLFFSFLSSWALQARESQRHGDVCTVVKLWPSRWWLLRQQWAIQIFTCTHCMVTLYWQVILEFQFFTKSSVFEMARACRHVWSKLCKQIGASFKWLSVFIAMKWDPRTTHLSPMSEDLLRQKTNGDKGTKFWRHMF